MLLSATWEKVGGWGEELKKNEEVVVVVAGEEKRWNGCGMVEGG